jgi:hypothetical protein
MTDNSNIVPGVMHCAKCKFRLIRTNLYVNTGTAGAGDNKTEPCPNGCGPLWPVTWEQEAREGFQIQEQLLDRAVRAEALVIELQRKIVFQDAVSAGLGRAVREKDTDRVFFRDALEELERRTGQRRRLYEHPPEGVERTMRTAEQRRGANLLRKAIGMGKDSMEPES